MKSRGEESGAAAAAKKTASLRAVFLLGVPRLRPPRRSPGLDPLGIVILLLCYFSGLASFTFR
jgi:hypothetical protein